MKASGTIHIIQRTKSLHEFLKRNKPSGADMRYILLRGTEDDRSVLKEHGWTEIVQERLDKSGKEKFLREYVDLVGAVGCECNSRMWWATDIASKNRSTSHLPSLLREFRSIVAAISATQDAELLIVNPSWVVMDSLRQYLKEHSLRYTHSLDYSGKWTEILDMRARTFGTLLYMILRVGIRKFIFTFKLWNRLKALSKDKTYYVVKTFLYSHSFREDGGYKDAFFGPLPDFLKETQEVLILADVLGSDRSSAEKVKGCGSHLIFPLEVFLRCSDILGAAAETALARVPVKKRSLFFGLDVSGIIRSELKRTCNGVSFYQYLHYRVVHRLLQTVRVDTFLLTYENNPWEKMCMMAIREHSPGTAIVGYQHTIVPQDSANAFISAREARIIPTPDRILTVGKIPKEIMEKYGSFENGKIEAACGLRFEYLFRLSSCKRSRRGHVLLALDGIDGAHKLVDYAFRELAGDPNCQVRIRTHPVLPLERFRTKLACRLEDASNFALSQNIAVRDDLEWADVVVYWGSTVSLEALSMGKPIIRYDMDPVFSHDPLFECEFLKWTVRDEISLLDTIREIELLDKNHFEEAQNRASNYLADYFFPVERQGLCLFLSIEKRRAALGLA